MKPYKKPNLQEIRMIEKIYDYNFQMNLFNFYLRIFFYIKGNMIGKIFQTIIFKKLRI